MRGREKNKRKRERKRRERKHNIWIEKETGKNKVPAGKKRGGGERKNGREG